MTIRRPLEMLLLAAALSWAAATSLLTTFSFFVARGSEVAVDIYTVGALTKAVTLLAVSVVWIVSVMGGRLRTRWALRAIGLVGLALSTHLVVFNNRRGVLEEHWLHFRVDRAAYHHAEGLYLDWAVQRVVFGIELINKDQRAHAFVFTGFPPWELDIEPSLHSHALGSARGGPGEWCAHANDAALAARTGVHHFMFSGLLRSVFTTPRTRPARSHRQSAVRLR